MGVRILGSEFWALEIPVLSPGDLGASPEYLLHPVRSLDLQTSSEEHVCPGGDALSQLQTILELRARVFVSVFWDGPTHTQVVQIAVGMVEGMPSRKGLVYIQQTDDSLIHFCWKDRTSGSVEDDLIIFPDDCEFKRVPQCPSGRVYVLKFKAGSKRLFFWMQEPKTDQDEEHCRKVNEYLNNPPMPGALGTSGSSGHELSALGGEGGLQSLLGNMSHSQLMQLIGPAGLGGLGGLGALTGPGLASLLGSGGPPASSSSSSSRSQSAAVTPSSTTSSTRPTPAPSAPAAASASSPSPAPSSGDGASTAASPTQPIQLSDLQSILATMNVPAGTGGSQQVDLASVLTPEIMAPILANADVQERLLPYLPSGESLPQTAEEIQNTLTSPQFQQALGMFSAALASGQLGPLMYQFGLPAEAVEAANKGDVEAFAKAMQSSAKSEPKEGDTKDKKDDEEDMSLD
ncbi:proteasomal ubiquitin receptor ADRM1 [Orycteropus afer afer]|uniref:Proteasomal ubiquitin receptor ADRM1 n=1 Tax=Orycteropus afer afer TaxID=1230840 RepID=A0A8B7AZ69_ORYAF|nr:proteasomal ubiquitin receptor ADRM1 [Orycteropus afer afer]